MRQLPVFAGASSVAFDATPPALVDHSCTKCKLHERAHNVCMAPELYGAMQGDVLMVVGVGPTNDDDRAGRPFSGVLGGYIRQQVQRLWKGPIVYDYAVHCAHGSNDITPNMIDACRPYTAGAYHEAKPTRILAFGSDAIRSVVGEGYNTMSVRRGYTHTAAGVPVFFMLSGIAALQNRFIRQWLESDIDWALTATPTKRPHQATVLMVTNPKEAQAAADDLALAEWTTWDLETFGAPFNREFVILNMALTPGDADYAFVLERSALEDPEVFRPIRAVLEDKSIKKCGQNLKFDLVGAGAKFGLRSRCDLDTMLWRRLFDAEAEASLEVIQTTIGFTGGKDEAQEQVDRGVVALRQLVTINAGRRKKYPAGYFDGAQGLVNLVRYLDDPALTGGVRWSVSASELQRAVMHLGLVDPKKFSAAAKQFAFAAIEPEVRSRYNGGDTISTDRARAKYLADGRTRYDVPRIWDKVVWPMAHAITQMEINGIAVDRGKIAELQQMCAVKMAALEKEFKQYGADFNPNSSVQVAELLFGTLKLPVLEATAGGAPSVAAEVLEKMKHPVAQQVLEYRRAGKFKVQYGDGMALFTRDDGRIHPQYRIAGTATGRPSAADPNMLNIPRPKTVDGKMCRDIFVAPPGYRLLEADYNQQELRVAAMLSGDQVMADIFRRGVDFHLETARMIAPAFGLDPATITKEHPLRDQAKIVNFSIAYGKEAKQLAAELGITQKQADNLVAAIVGKFARFRDWRKAQVNFVRHHGYVRTWWDGEDFRTRPLHHIADADGEQKSTAERASYNTPVQGTAAEFMNASLGAIQEWLEEDHVPAKLVLTVYDSVLLEVREDAVPEVAWNVRRIMQGWNSMDVPIVAEFKAGQAWGSLEGYKVAA